MLYSFSYYKPKSEIEIIETLKSFGDDAKILAGGTDLLVYMKQQIADPKVLVDIKGVPDFSKIEIDSSGNLIIGAAVTCNDVVENQYIRNHYPILATAAKTIGSYQIRNRATVVGNICNASPAADMAGALLVLDSSVIIATEKGNREIPIKQFFVGVKKTSLQQNEFVKAIRVRAEYKDAEAGYLKASRIKGHDLGTCNVALSRGKNGTVKIAIGSCNITPVLLPDFDSTNIDLANILTTAMKNIKPIDDLRGSKEYRKHLVQVFIKRLLNGKGHSH
ncbi:MAG: xanthine dehydrogenase family protein subunit M [Bacteroidota bacterium]|nr:xanthine dehydrogenase family protein subunit M [Bacteroidota bacterium]